LVLTEGYFAQTAPPRNTTVPRSIAHQADRVRATTSAHTMSVMQTFRTCSDHICRERETKYTVTGSATAIVRADRLRLPRRPPGARPGGIGTSRKPAYASSSIAAATETPTTATASAIIDRL
jgi:hypothetical protein